MNKRKIFLTPIVIIGYKRLTNIKLLLSQVRDLKANKLFIILDGPKNNDEKQKTLKVRELVESKQWAQSIYINASPINMGLRSRVVSGLDWVFSQVDRAIIIEDDLLPDPTFYYFCAELLAKYANSEKVISIAGYSYKPNKKKVINSYYFSKHVESWGWATWRRAWAQYDNEMKDWTRFRNSNWFSSLFNNILTEKYWEKAFDNTLSGKVDSWAYRWAYTSFRTKSLNIVPGRNLISYHGWGAEATHTKISFNANNEVGEVEFPLIHPKNVKVNQAIDKFTEKEQGIMFLASIIKGILKI